MMNDITLRKQKGTPLKFILPSLLGIFLFMLPVPTKTGITIPVAILSSGLQTLLNPSMTNILYITIFISAIGGLAFKIFKPRIKSSFLQSLFNPSLPWLCLRIIALFFMTIIVLAPHSPFISELALFEAIISADTGSMVVQDLLPVLFSIFLFAGLFLPLLLNFGLLEFVGTLLVRVMRPIFGLPGRAAIDCIASWLGDGTIGVLLTSKQYEEGFYTQKEAAIIGTNFSLVSITFSLVIINTVELGEYFIPFYLTVCISSVVAAIVLPKFPPLSLKKDCLYDGSLPDESQKQNTHSHKIKDGFKLAVEKASSQDFFKCVVIDGSKNVLDMWIAVIPTVMAIGTIALILASYTPIFSWLGMPFTPFLQLLGIPEAAAASQTIIAGFADMLLPSVLASSIESELTRFVIASVSVTQLIYLSEVGSLLLGSKIPVKLWELFVIFIERTLITLPIISLMAHLIF